MKKLLGTILFVFIMLAAAIIPAVAQEDSPLGERDQKFEQEVYERLTIVNPDAVAVFKSATDAMDAGDFVTAQKGFEKVLLLAPGFPDALRRLSQTFYYQRDIDQAEEIAREALVAANTPENQSWLAIILLNADIPAKNTEAFELAKKAVQAQPEDVYNHYALMFASAAVEDLPTLEQSSAAMIRLAPQEPYGHIYAGIVAANSKKWELAERELHLAKELGGPAEEIQNILDQGITSQALFQRATRWGLYGLAGWIGTLGLLFLLGLILSQVTLASVNRQKGLTSIEISPAERLTRQIYRVVIAITSAYFYLSIPILLVIVVAVTGLIFYAFFAIGQIPIKIALIILLACLYTIYAVVRSLFIRRRQGNPGKEISRSDSLALWDMLLETSRKIGTRPVDKVFLSASDDIAVFERGSWLNRLRGHGERCLILGLGALPGMNQGQLRAIIAHEYGHFKNADTAGGDLANTVSFNIHNMAQGMASVGTAAWYNPVWLFINGYYRIFMRITQGASRLQEILADRYATVLYGVRNMKSGLEHVIRQSLVFDAQVTNEIDLAIESKRSLQNLYTLSNNDANLKVEEAFNRIMQESTSPYSSHPSPRDRLAFIERVPNVGLIQEDARPAWDLLSSSADIQEEMTREIEQNLCQQGILNIV